MIDLLKDNTEIQYLDLLIDFEKNKYKLLINENN